MLQQSQGQPQDQGQGIMSSSPQPDDFNNKDVSSLTTEPTTDEPTLRAVASWLTRIRSAKKKWEPDFKRMRDNARFAAGWQWAEQTELDDERYTANITLQMVKQKEATLYARNPTVTYQRRDRLVYQLWDGRLETLAQAVLGAQATQGQDMQSMALIMDYQNGLKLKELLDKVGTTLEILYKWNCDENEPDFKKQMKTAVRRTIITGVGYVKQEFERSSNNDLLGATQLDVSPIKRMKAAQFIMRKLAAGEIDKDDERIIQLKGLLESLTSSSQQQYQQEEISERLVYNFPKSWNIIPDEACTDVDGFINSDWVAEQFLMPLDDMNSFFGVNIQATSITKFYNDAGQSQELKDFSVMTDGKPLLMTPRVCVYEVYNKTNKTKHYILDGWTDFLVAPQPIEPCTKHFWPWFGLTFNSVEACDDSETPVSPFPPSDVQQMKHAQKEWNRTRNELREHRKAKVPRTLIFKGLLSLSEGDKDKLMTAPSNGVIEVDALPSSGKLSDAIAAWPTEAIDPTVYDNKPLQEDVLMTTGLQEANIGPAPSAKSRETATGASIAEQSRVSKSSSNVDDLDGLLDDLALNGGQLLMHECSAETVHHIVGPGAVWPQGSMQDFLNLVYLQVEAASSGRPNKAMEISNWGQLGPMLQQLGANPYAMVRETVKRLDDRLDPDMFFPLIPAQNVPPNMGGGQGGQGDEAQPQGQMGQGQGQGQPQSQGLSDGTTPPQPMNGQMAPVPPMAGQRAQ